MPVGNIGAFYDAGNVVVGQAAGFTAPADTAQPADSITVFDPTIYVAPWTPAGATEQGWQVSYNPNVQNIDIEEQQTSVGQQVQSAVFQFIANLAEDTVNSLKLALSATSTVQAPDATHFGKTTLNLQESLPVLAVVLETSNTLGMPRRYYVPRATCAANVGQTFRRAAAARLVPVTFTAICDLSEIVVEEITAAMV